MKPLLQQAIDSLEFTLGKPIIDKEKWKAEQKPQKRGVYFNKKPQELSLMNDQLDYEDEKIDTDEFPTVNPPSKPTLKNFANNSPQLFKRNNSKNVFI